VALFIIMANSATTYVTTNVKLLTTTGTVSIKCQKSIFQLYQYVSTYNEQKKHSYFISLRVCYWR